MAIAERSCVYDGYVANQKEAVEIYSKQVQRAVKYAISDSEADAFVKESKEEWSVSSLHTNSTSTNRKTKRPWNAR